MSEPELAICTNCLQPVPKDEYLEHDNMCARCYEDWIANVIGAPL